jgi:hypothetical protein
MSWKICSGLPLAEIAQLVTCLACLVINSITLRDAFETRRRIISSGRNHGADIWSWINVRGKGCFVAVQLLIVAMGVDRLNLLLHGYHPELMNRWVAFGLARTVIGLLVAATAWANMRSFQRLRDSE